MSQAPYPPGPRGLNRLWAVVSSLADPLRVGAWLTREHGDVARVRVGPKQGVVVGHPAVVHELLVKQNANFAKDQRYRSMPEVLGEGLLTSHGETWLYQRRAIQSGFDQRNLRGFVPVIDGHAGRMLADWEARPERDAHEDLQRTMAAIIYHLAIGRDLPAEASEVAARFRLLLEYWWERGARLGLKVPRFMWSGRDRRFQRTLKTLSREVDRSVAAHRGGGGAADSFLSRMLAGYAGQGASPSDGELREQVMTLLLAGFDTTSSLVTWVLYALARRADLQESVLAELGGGEDADADSPLLGAVINECARLYPPVWGFGREALTDTTLGGYRIDRGTQLILIPYLLHRDRRFFERPERFDPGRWLRPGWAPEPGSYIPFGAGPRRCVGQHLALLEARVIVARALRRYRLALSPGFRVALDPGITLRPRHGLRLRVSPR